jgi:hypothetical protein
MKALEDPTENRLPQFLPASHPEVGREPLLEEE